jgi:hypothetical protein
VVFFVGFGATRLLVVGGFLANLVSTKLADALFDGVGGNELCDDLLSLLVDTRSLDGTVDKGRSLARVESEETFRVLVNFNLGDFEDGLGYLRLIILRVEKVA